ncbi:MAG: hypothetical protein AAF512_02530 [Pseudomonadota bacterium]
MVDAKHAEIDPLHDYNAAQAATGQAIKQHQEAQTQFNLSRYLLTELNFLATLTEQANLTHQREALALANLRSHVESITKRRDFLKTYLPPTENRLLWAPDDDYVYQVDETYGTMEIDGLKEKMMLRPPRLLGVIFSDNTDTGNEWRPDDGIHQPVVSSTKYWYAVHFALHGGWQKWRPRYRLGEVVEVSSTGYRVRMLDRINVQSNLSINQTNELTNVRALYPGSTQYLPDDRPQQQKVLPFKPGEQVVIGFLGNDWGRPRLIGYSSFPRPLETWQMVIQYERDRRVTSEGVAPDGHPPITVYTTVKVSLWCEQLRFHTSSENIVIQDHQYYLDDPVRGLVPLYGGAEILQRTLRKKAIKHTGSNFTYKYSIAAQQTDEFPSQNLTKYAEIELRTWPRAWLLNSGDPATDTKIDPKYSYIKTGMLVLPENASTITVERFVETIHSRGGNPPPVNVFQDFTFDGDDAFAYSKPNPPPPDIGTLPNNLQSRGLVYTNSGPLGLRSFGHVLVKLAPLVLKSAGYVTDLPQTGMTGIKSTGRVFSDNQAGSDQGLQMTGRIDHVPAPAPQTAAAFPMFYSRGFITRRQPSTGPRLQLKGFITTAANPLGLSVKGRIEVRDKENAVSAISGRGVVITKESGQAFRGFGGGYQMVNVSNDPENEDWRDPKSVGATSLQAYGAAYSELPTQYPIRKHTETENPVIP